MIFIDENTTREELVAIWHDNVNDLVDAFIAAGIDPDEETVSADEIRAVIVAWIEEGDECASA